MAKTSTNAIKETIARRNVNFFMFSTSLLHHNNGCNSFQLVHVTGLLHAEDDGAVFKQLQDLLVDFLVTVGHKLNVQNSGICAFQLYAGCVCPGVVEIVVLVAVVNVVSTVIALVQITCNVGDYLYISLKYIFKHQNP